MLEKLRRNTVFGKKKNAAGGHGKKLNQWLLQGEQLPL